MSFKLGLRSRLRLRGVHPDLVRVVERAITLTPVDFTVLEGVRSVATQTRYVASGASQTMNSKHLKQADGLGHAVDLAPLLNGRVSWHWPLYYPMAQAMKDATEMEGVLLRWGGAWTEAFNGNPATPHEMSSAYATLRRSQGGKVFTDGPHFELVT